MTTPLDRAADIHVSEKEDRGSDRGLSRVTQQGNPAQAHNDPSSFLYDPTTQHKNIGALDNGLDRVEDLITLFNLRKKPKEEEILNLTKQNFDADDFDDCYQGIGRGSFGYVYINKEKTRVVKEIYPNNLVNKNEIIVPCGLKVQGIRVVENLALSYSGSSFRILMSYAGKNLNDVKAQKIVKENMALVGRDLFRCVKCLQDLGFSHGDIKPDNVCVDEDGRITLIDFGSAQHRHSDGHNTPEYLPPEVVEWKRWRMDGIEQTEMDFVEKNVDVFAVALVLLVVWNDGRHPMNEVDNYSNNSDERKQQRKDVMDKIIRNEENYVNQVSRTKYIPPRLKTVLTNALSVNWGVRWNATQCLEYFENRLAAGDLLESLVSQQTEEIEVDASSKVEKCEDTPILAAGLGSASEDILHLHDLELHPDEAVDLLDNVEIRLSKTTREIEDCTSFEVESGGEVLPIKHKATKGTLTLAPELGSSLI